MDKTYRIEWSQTVQEWWKYSDGAFIGGKLAHMRA